MPSSYPIEKLGLILELVFKRLNAVTLARAGQVCRFWRVHQKREFAKRGMIQVINFPFLYSVQENERLYFQKLRVKPQLAILFICNHSDHWDRFNKQFFCPVITTQWKRVYYVNDSQNAIDSFESFRNMRFRSRGIALIVPDHDAVHVSAIHSLVTLFAQKPGHTIRQMARCLDFEGRYGRKKLTLLMFGRGHASHRKNAHIRECIEERFLGRQIDTWGGSDAVRWEKDNCLTMNPHLSNTVLVNLQGPSLTSCTAIFNYLDRTILESEIIDFKNRVVTRSYNYGLLNIYVSTSDIPALEKSLDIVRRHLPKVKFIILFNECRGCETRSAIEVNCRSLYTISLMLISMDMNLPELL